MDEEIFEWHWPEGAGANYILKRQWELVDLLSSKSPIFLDTNFWIMARQAAFKESNDSELEALLNVLRLAVDSGKFFFPITSDLIGEFSKQSPERLTQTMLLVDQLSLGVAMVPHHERTTIEMESFIARAFPDHPPAPRPLWTSSAFALGYADICPQGVEGNDAILVACAEKAWMTPPSILAKKVSPEVFAAKSKSEQMAQYLNEQEALHTHEIDSHATALRIEVAGAASMIIGIAAPEYRRIAATAGQAQEADNIKNSIRVGREIAGMIAQALERDEHRRAFGSLYVPAMLHAAVRSETNRKIKPNDVYDFRHAAAALPYCRAFLTDGPLRSLITSGHVCLDKLYNCEIVSTPREAIELISRLTKE